MGERLIIASGFLMKKPWIIFILFSLCCPISESSLFKKKSNPLPEQYRKWLEEEVVYIIRSKEKDIFLQLETDRERDIFVEAFWKQRDPTPGTPENEFKKEHYRRIAYANKFLGRDTPKPGWKTDRGRIYIILGDPVDIDRYESSDNYYPSEVWFYQGDVKYGLPPHFNIAFFKKRGIGEYILYSPVEHGPQQLLRNYYGSPTDYETAYEELRKLDTILAEVSLTLIPGERPLAGHPSLSSEIMISNIFDLPMKKIDDVYAEKLLRYKDIVEVEYTANYIGNDYLVNIIKDPSDIFFVHFAINPETLSVGSYEDDKYYSYFELNTQVSDTEGKTVFQYQKNYPLNFTKEQVEDIKLKSYSIQDMFPLIAGQYKLNVLLKNTVSKEFTSFEADIFIPPLNSLLMTFPLLSYKVEENPGFGGQMKPFKSGRFQLHCQPIKTFTQKEELGVFFQLYGLSKELEEEGGIHYIFYKENEEAMTKRVKINEIEDKTNFIQIFPLQGFVPGYYSLKIALVDKEDNEILSQKSDFTIPLLEGIARPWIISRAVPAASQTIEYSFILGNQLLSTGQIRQALSPLETAYRANPDSLRFAYGFSRALFMLKEYQRVKEVLKPFQENPQKSHEFLSLLGKTCQAMQEYEEAVQYYKEYLSHMGTNLMVLNAIGECYFLLGNNEEALIAWEKSLEIDYNQEIIKEKVKSLKGKRQ